MPVLGEVMEEKSMGGVGEEEPTSAAGCIWEPVVSVRIVRRQRLAPGSALAIPLVGVPNCDPPAS